MKRRAKSGSEDEDYAGDEGYRSGGSSGPRAAPRRSNAQLARAAATNASGRARPTNNQLL
jgi:hypothetical protein